MLNLGHLYEFAENCTKNWGAAESIDWTQAQDLVGMCRDIPAQYLAVLTAIDRIVAYVKEHEDNDWDSGEMGNWPAHIIDELESHDKQLGYRVDPENSERWEVYGLYFTGEEDWVATVDTETIAETLVKSLHGFTLPDPVSVNNERPIQSLANDVAADKTNDDGSRFIFSGNTKRVDVSLAALKRMEYGEIITVPVEFSDEDLTALTGLAWENVDGTDYFEDVDYWKRERANFEEVEKKANSNCLHGMRCPNCSSLGPFRFATKGPNPDQAYGMGQMELHSAVDSGDVDFVEYMAEWHDDGSVDTAGDTEFVSSGDGRCESCDFEGTVADFYIKERIPAELTD